MGSGEVGRVHPRKAVGGALALAHMGPHAPRTFLLFLRNSELRELQRGAQPALSLPPHVRNWSNQDVQPKREKA